MRRYIKSLLCRTSRQRDVKKPPGVVVKPREVSRAGDDEFHGMAWNAFVDLVGMSDLENLNNTQRIAHLAFWYDSEVQNGGHDQYFGNNDYFDHQEVISALEILGATCQAQVLTDALTFFSGTVEEIPETYDAFVKWDKATRYSKKLYEFDARYYGCSPELGTELLENYLNRNEAEFIKWVE